MEIVKRIVTSKIFISLSLLFGAGIIFVIIFNARCGSTQSNFKPVQEKISEEQTKIIKEIKKYNRTEESTYLAFPEWYLVYSPQEYAQFLDQNAPSHFPYFRSIGQFWSGYCQVYGITMHGYKFNIGDHLMLAVIGTSFSVEYAIKGLYENTIGRISEWISSGADTSEDKYAAKVAREYGEFIPTDPWYEFPFAQKFIGLWKETGLRGPHFLRKWERKSLLSFEYLIKAGYGWLIKIASHTVYGIADTEVYAIVESAPIEIFKDSRVHKVKELTQRSYVITLPHYQGFTDTVPSLARQNVKFTDIAGNDEILLTAIAPRDWVYSLKDGALLFTMEILTMPQLKRIAVQAPVKSLDIILTVFETQGIKIEHIYDY